MLGGTQKLARFGQAQGYPIANVCMVLGMFFEKRIIEGVEVTSQVGVADSLLGTNKILTGGKHGYTRRGKQHGEGEAGATLLRYTYAAFVPEQHAAVATMAGAGVTAAVTPSTRLC